MKLKAKKSFWIPIFIYENEQTVTKANQAPIHPPACARILPLHLPTAEKAILVAKRRDIYLLQHREP